MAIFVLITLFKLINTSYAHFNFCPDSFLNIHDAYIVTSIRLLMFVATGGCLRQFESKCKSLRLLFMACLS